MQKPTECYNPTPCILAQYKRADGELVELSNGFSIPEGKGTLGVAIIGEGLGHEEAIDGLPFRPRAQAGSQLEDCFRRLGVNREQFFIWNILGCQPPGNLLDGMWYEDSAISTCMARHFTRVLDSFRTPHTKVLLAMGNVATRVLTGLSGLASEKQSVSNVRGYVFPSKWGWVVPTYHPSYIRRGNPHLIPAMLADMRKAIAIAQGRYTDFEGHSSYNGVNYQTTPSVIDAWDFYYRAQSNSKLMIGYDIETPNSKLAEEDEREDEEYLAEPIESVQFSLAAREGIFLPYQGEYIEIAKKIMELLNRKLAFNNWFFDDPIMRKAGFNFGGGLSIDLMWMFKHWHPRLERGLQKVASLFDFPFPWKHLYGSNMGVYGCADVDSLHWILPRLVAAMKGIKNEQGVSVWQGYIEQIYQVHPIMTKASGRGFPVSSSRHGELREKLKEQLLVLDRELQELVPDELKNISPKRKVK